MVKLCKHIFSVVLSLFCLGLFAQEETNSSGKEKLFTVRGSVVYSDIYNPISNAKVQINGALYTTTDQSGNFKVEVKIGDQLVIKHDDFETVYYTIINDERIKIKVEYEESRSKEKPKFKTFNSLIDSTSAYLTKDAEKSIQFVTEALEVASSSKEYAEVYEVLADVYFEWKQYDLALSNYKISLQNIISSDVKLKLAKAYEFNKKYTLGISEYKSLNIKRLSNWQRVIYYEGLGDIYLKTTNYSKAITNYEEGLRLAKRYKINRKVTDLNTKIATVYSESGNKDKAKRFFEKTLKLSEEENRTRAVEAKIIVADFENENRAYNDEIEIRKEALEVIKNIETDSIFKNESALTPQKQNYKIGNAYLLQDNPEKAIPFFERSIEAAEEREDIEVKKDAYKRIAVAHNNRGNVNEAIEAIKKYEVLIDEVYIKKEQEILRTSRLSKDLASKQIRILGLEKDRELSESKYQVTQEQYKNQKLIIASLIGGLILVLITVYVMLKNIKQQRLTNNLLALKSLRSQMNPHFIFNALNSVNSFIATNDERTANKYLSDFSLLMRSVLENSEESFIPLEKEIELLELYTKLEHSRFKDKFEYDIKVDENVNIQEFQIPPMLLQPYIENAVWHGLRYKKEKGQLNIVIDQQTNDVIKITITDDGIGRKQSKVLKTKNQQKQNSKGMGNIKKRVAILNKMYKDKVDVFIDDYQDKDDAGTIVVVTLKKD